MVPFARETGYGLVPHSPLAGGFLTGKYRRGEAAPGDSRGARREGFLDERSDEQWALLERLVEAAREAGCTPGQAAIAWVLTRPFVDATIIGPRTVEQFRDNLGAQDVRLSEAAVAGLDAASEFAVRLPRT